MKSKRTKRFRELLKALPIDVKRQAYAAYRLFKHDPGHPSLHFKRVGTKQPFYSARVGKGYRAIGLRETDDIIIWVWIGTHAEYDKILPRL
ncbi:MAG: type II toxin-antitoxin system RelE family toxin [Aggregatilineales bacterium]